MTVVAPYPKRRLSPELIAASRNSRLPRSNQALLAGWKHLSNFSTLLHTRRRITVTPEVQRRFENLAALLFFPPDGIWLEESQEER
jgi:hypothetical protein